MKKTLITLAALTAAISGVAAAEDYTFAVPTGGNYYGGDFSFTFTIPSADLIGADTMLAYYRPNSDSNNPDSNIFMLHNTDGAITLTVGRGDLMANGTFSAWYGSDNKTFTTTLQQDVVYTISSKGADQSQTVTLSADGMTSESVNYAGNMNGGGNGGTNPIVTYFNQDFAVKTSEGGSDNIPEPTTATLSLLALAGLAARRRRK